MARVASTLGRYCRRTQGCLLEGRREYGGSTTVGDNSRCSVQVDVGGRWERENNSIPSFSLGFEMS